MDFDHGHVRRLVKEDRLSSLPDELIHKILSCFGMKFVVQTCLLSSRWKLVWKSMPYLNFSSNQFPGVLSAFARFVTHVLSLRNHQSQVYSVNLYLHGKANKDFVRQIANYAFSHNVQELSFDYWSVGLIVHPTCLFSSQSLKHFTFSSRSWSNSVAITTPWDFPALTTLHLSDIGLCSDIFSNCVNLKNLTLKRCHVTGEEAFDIITPRLSNLTLISGSSCLKVINIIAPQLENFTIINFSIKHLNAPPGLPSLCYKGYDPPPLPKDGFNSANKVTIHLSTLHEEEYACKTINMLQELHSARYLTLNADIVECISSFPDLLSQHSSPFSNLICLTIDYCMREGATYKVKMSTEARNFLLGNSPNATFIMHGC